VRAQWQWVPIIGPKPDPTKAETSAYADGVSTEQAVDHRYRGAATELCRRGLRVHVARVGLYEEELNMESHCTRYKPALVWLTTLYDEQCNTRYLCHRL